MVIVLLRWQDNTYIGSLYNNHLLPVINSLPPTALALLRWQANNTGIGLLLGHLVQFGLHNIPPATRFLIGAQTVMFLAQDILPSPEDVCISSYNVYYRKEWLRALLSAFYHGNDMHLYYNMISLLYKGSWLELKFGTPYFIYLITVFTTIINALYVALGLFFSWLFDDTAYLKTCAVGFSGVLFALKVLTTHYAPRGPQILFGFLRVPSTYMYWLELVFIQIMVPNASFAGHLAGILVGVCYIYGPLKWFMELFFDHEGSSVDAPVGMTSPRRSGTQLDNRDGGQEDDQQPDEQPDQQPPPRLREPSLDIVLFQSPSRLRFSTFYSGLYHNVLDLLSRANFFHR